MAGSDGRCRKGWQRWLRPSGMAPSFNSTHRPVGAGTSSIDKCNAMQVRFTQPGTSTDQDSTDGDGPAFMD